MELGDLLVKFVGQRPASHLPGVDELTRELVEFGRFVEGGLQVVCSMGSRVAVVDERSAEGAGDVAMLPLGPDAHQKLDVVQRPGAALEVAICPVELLGVGSVHAYVPLVVLVEIPPDPDNIFRAARVQCEAEANVCNEVVEALLPIECCAGKWEGQGPGVLDAEGQGGADVTDGGLWDRAKAGSVGPALTPGSEASVGGGFPGVHPN